MTVLILFLLFSCLDSSFKIDKLKWQRKGIIRAVRLPTGKLRYPRSEVERLWRQLRATESQ